MKSTLSSLLITCCCLIGCSTKEAKKIQVIPEPFLIKNSEGTIVLDKNSSVYLSPVDGALKAIYQGLVASTSASMGWEFPITTDPDKARILLQIDENLDTLGNEGYYLLSSDDKIKILSASPAGLFYGVQSLLQLLPPQIVANKVQQNITWEVPRVEIMDKPRFGYRGMHLDVSRHFMTKEEVKRYLDMLAMLKINRFHWHLTDDQGWRIEIKKYPKLTEVGAWRVVRTEMWHDRPFAEAGEVATYGGFYTQDDIREVVAYAKERFIEVVPEIDMPGHIVAVLASYPEFSCDHADYRVIPGGYWPPTDILCVGNDQSIEFVRDVLTEVMDLFPYEYIHIGGDETVKTKWKTCPKCQARIKEKRLQNELELQSWFISDVEQFVLSKGKKIIGWDEILEGGLAPEATVMSWRGEEGGVEAASLNHDVIMTPYQYLYLDFLQDNPEREPMAMHEPDMTTLRRVYNYDPVPAELKKEGQKHILGAQANVWTEFMPNFEHVQYMASSRMCALSEITWSVSENKNYIRFWEKLQAMHERYDILDIPYSTGSSIVDMRHSNLLGDSISVTMESDYPDVEIYYTIDGSEPSTTSIRYERPAILQKPIELKAVLIRNDTLLENSMVRKKY